MKIAFSTNAMTIVKLQEFFGQPFTGKSAQFLPSASDHWVLGVSILELLRIRIDTRSERKTYAICTNIKSTEETINERRRASAERAPQERAPEGKGN